MTAPVNVLVIFCSPDDLTEQLALAAAVGAVQGRASIRIRRLSGANERPDTGNETLSRMQREYVSPTLSDTTWADAVIIAMSSKLAGRPGERNEAVAYGLQVASGVRALKQSQS
jgi:hypothetical protein